MIIGFRFLLLLSRAGPDAVYTVDIANRSQYGGGNTTQQVLCAYEPTYVERCRQQPSTVAKCH